MRTLFFRIFVSFWLAMVLILGGAVAITATVAWYRITMLGSIDPTDVLEGANTALQDRGMAGIEKPPAGRYGLARIARARRPPAIGLAHRGKALALAGVCAGTGRLAALAGALALAGVRTHAMAVSGLCNG